MPDLTTEERALMRRLLIGHAAKATRLAKRASESRDYDDLRGKGQDRSEWLKARWQAERTTAFSALAKLA